MKEKRSKKIVIISLNFYPEDTAIGLYSTQMAEYLHNSGWDVSVITGFPYYPEWDISEDYKNKKKYLIEDHKGIKIFRYRQFTPQNPTFIKRIFHIIDFTLGSTFNAKKIKQTDVILSVIPFTSSAWLGKKLAKRLDAKHWIHIQDFEFDVAMESGISPGLKLNNFIFTKLKSLESKILNSAEMVSTISYAMLEKLKTKYSGNTCYFPNWIDDVRINPFKAKKHKYLSSKKFKVLYSGNIGAKQDWDFFLQVLKHFENNDQIEFIIVGQGSLKNTFLKQTKSFKNVKHFDPVPFEELNNLLCSADLHILFQKDDVFDTVMPSKILGMMASGIPSLVTGNIKSDVAKMIEFSKSGYFYKASELQLVVHKIEELRLDKNRGKMIGQNARKYVQGNFSRKSILEKFNTKLIEVCYD